MLQKTCVRTATQLHVQSRKGKKKYANQEDDYRGDKHLRERHLVNVNNRNDHEFCK